VSEESEVLATNEAFYAAFNARDLGAMDRLWAREHAVACVHPGWNVLSGREQVMQSWAAILSNPAQPRITSGGERVFLLGDVAYVICREPVAGAPLAATNVFAREEGEWRLLHHHSSAVAMG
jgi:ketosteroid isomerase-like protein